MIAAFLSRRLRTYALLAVGAPVAAWALSEAGRLVEQRAGENKVSRALSGAGGWVKEHQRGPFARR